MRAVLPLLLALAAPALAEESGDRARNQAHRSLAWARTMNDATRFASPPTEFRTGHVSPLSLAEGSITRSDGRFEVRFPSGAPITTPAVHRGRVVVSGGFHGKELYALDARTGALAWGRHLDDDGPSAPACADGVCVFNTESCTVFALSADTGELLWSHWMGDPMLAAPAIAGGRVFTSYPVPMGWVETPGGPRTDFQVGGHDDEPPPPGATHALAALDLRTGRILWQRWIDGDVMSSPVAVADEVHLTTFAGTVWTLAQADGEIRAVARGRATSAPTVAGEDLWYAERSDARGQPAREHLVRADKDSRTRELAANEKAAPYVDRSVQSSTGYEGQGTKLDASNGFASVPTSAGADKASAIVGKASVATLQAHQGSRVLYAGGVGYSTMGDEVVATDAASGEVRWSRKLEGDLSRGGSLAAAPAWAGGRLVVGTLAGHVRVLDPASGQVLKTYEIGHPIRSQPVVDGGWIYVGTEDGRLIGVDTGDRTLTGWTMWGGNPARTATADRAAVLR